MTSRQDWRARVRRPYSVYRKNQRYLNRWFRECESNPDRARLLGAVGLKLLELEGLVYAGEAQRRFFETPAKLAGGYFLGGDGSWRR